MSWESQSPFVKLMYTLSETKVEHDSLRLRQVPRTENVASQGRLLPVVEQCEPLCSPQVLCECTCTFQGISRATGKGTDLPYTPKKPAEEHSAYNYPTEATCCALSMRHPRSLRVSRILFHRKSHSVCWRLQFVFLILLLVNFDLMIFSGSVYMKATQKISKIFSKLID